MGFTMYLAAVYLLLFVIGIAAFLKGRKNKKWLPFIIITAIMHLISRLFIISSLFHKYVSKFINSEFVFFIAELAA